MWSERQVYQLKVVEGSRGQEDGACRGGREILARQRHFETDGRFAIESDWLL